MTDQLNIDIQRPSFSTAAACNRRSPSAVARALPRALLCAALVAALAGCDPDVAPRTSTPGATVTPPDTELPAGEEAPAENPSSGPGTEPAGENPVTESEQSSGPGADSYSLSLPSSPVVLTEGEGAVSVPVTINRGPSHARPVTFAATEEGVSENGLVWTFSSTILAANTSQTSVSISLPIGPLPRLPETRRLRLVGTDGSGQSVSGDIVIDTTPTPRPDVYLLAGQSNMVGSPEEDARLMGPGEPDEPNPRILQLDVTINDLQRFPNPEAYTDIARIAVADQRIVEALDPLHDTRDRGMDTKSGTTIGMGLSFAKAALPNTTANIVLVPAAWSDSGFCVRSSTRFDGQTGWNADAPDSALLSGTLLHDRAIARTNLALAETGGILRGILWHQGEADSDESVCALSYDDNLRDMVASFRSRIAPDARGGSARGANANIPFIAGTMSKGADTRAEPFAPGGQFREPKNIVDDVHRNLNEIVPFSGFVNGDDLVPPAFPCGQGSCIHFGSSALREFGVRYYRQLLAVFGQG